MMPRRAIYLGAALALLVCELLVATVFQQIGWVRGELGDILAALLLYAALRLFRDDRPPLVALFVLAAAWALEIGQYFHLADALGLARGSLPSVLLGNTFSWVDLLMYAIGCAVAYAADTARRRASPRSRAGG